MTEREAYLAFNLTERIGSVGVADRVARHGSVALAWENEPSKISRAGGNVDVAAELQKAKKYGVTILTPADPAYPQTLLKTRGHPLALYVKGNVAALEKAGVAIVGTRRATQYGRDQANRFGFELAERGWNIISGLALGIDAEAHRGALDAHGTTVGVLGSALDRFYPEGNRELAREMVRKGGAVVSEFPFGRDPDTQTFPQRNHIVAALAQGVLAIEAPVKSGALITTRIAADLGRIVMALPGRVDSSACAGCLNLLRDGATLIRCPGDVEEALGGLSIAPPPPRKTAATPEKPKAPHTDDCPPPFTVEEALVMRHIDTEGISIDKLIDLTGLDAGKVNALAMTLRLKGRIRFLPGNRLALPRRES